MNNQKHGAIYLIPTTISEGQLQVIPDQVRSTIKKIDYYLVENIRTARRYISSLKLGLVIEDLVFEQVNKNTKQQEVEYLVKPIFQGKNIGVLSESGCPGVADPGALVAAVAHKKNIEVVPLVGPSSILLALMASGFNGQKFAFHGYLPVDKRDLSLKLNWLEKESLKHNQTQIFIETPYRNNQLLKSIIDACQSDTSLTIARDITGSAEYIKTYKISQWKNQNIDLHKVPTVFLLYAGHL